MIRNFYACCLYIMLLVLALPYHAAYADSASKKSFTYDDFKEIPILHEGRVKPLESFARSYLLVFHGKSQLNSLSASEWLAELLFDQESAYQRQLFNISNPDVVHAIGLPWTTKHRYSYKEVSNALQIHNDTVATLYRMEEKQRTHSQQELLNLFFKSYAYAEISHSLSLIQPRFTIRTPEVAKILNSQVGNTLAYIDLVGYEDLITDRVKLLAHGDKNGDEEDRTPEEQELLDIAFSIVVLSEHKNTTIFRIIPPQWKQASDVWYSPWENIIQGKGSPQSAAYLELWRDLAQAYQSNNDILWQNTAKALRDHAFQIAGTHASMASQNLEVLYHKLNLFHWALVLYGLCALLLTVHFVQTCTGSKS